MEHTTNHQLSQWESTDRIQMQDFNADNAKIDAALAVLATASAKHGNCQIYPFTYTGTGGAQTLTFPRKPLLVLMVDGSGCAAVCIHGAQYTRALGSNSSSIRLTWGENSLSWNSYEMNGGGTHLAIAFFGMDA